MQRRFALARIIVCCGASICSSLCSQSEGHEHVANMASAQSRDFVGFLAVFGRHNIRSPSLCEQSELQCFASDLRRMFAQRFLLLCRNRHAIWSKTRRDFYGISLPLLFPPLQPSCKKVSVTLQKIKPTCYGKRRKKHVRMWGTPRTGR